MISIKTEKEIEDLRECGKRLASILYAVADKTKPGISTAELDAYAFDLATKSGDTPAFLHYRPAGNKKAYPASLCVSVNDVIVHGIPNKNPQIIKEGDVVTLDMGLTHKGLITDMAITLGIEPVSAEDKQLIEVTEKSLDMGIKAVKSGGHVGDIGHAIESFVKAYGYGMAENLSGHGVGYKVHEDPFVPNRGNAGEGPELRVGMVLAIEPMLTIGKSGKVVFEKDEYTVRTKDGTRAAHFEHTIVVTENGAEILTR